MPTDSDKVDPRYCYSIGPECPIEASIYGYYPSFGANIFFATLFGICFLANIFLGIRYKTWTYMTALLLACACSALGYAGRVLLHNNPFDDIGFEIQICCLTLSPAFNSAAIYLMLKHIVRHFGRQWSRIRPKFYTWGFITADIFALVLQGVGGGLAATAEDNLNQLNTGDHLMMAGIAMQVVTLVVFGAMITDFLVRRFVLSGSKIRLSRDAQETAGQMKFKVFTVCLVITYFCVLIRCIYRIAEMSGGWQNSIMQNQALFIGLDSVLVSVATVLQTAAHPGICFKAFTDKAIVRSETQRSNDPSVEREQNYNEGKGERS